MIRHLCLLGSLTELNIGFSEHDDSLINARNGFLLPKWAATYVRSTIFILRWIMAIADRWVQELLARKCGRPHESIEAPNRDESYVFSRFRLPTCPLEQFQWFILDPPVLSFYWKYALDPRWINTRMASPLYLFTYIRFCWKVRYLSIKKLAKVQDLVTFMCASLKSADKRSLSQIPQILSRGAPEAFSIILYSMSNLEEKNHGRPIN